jgi:membrane peptidoglycan carboxypeptidase
VGWLGEAGRAIPSRSSWVPSPSGRTSSRPTARDDRHSRRGERQPIPLADVPAHVIDAILAVEDAGFGHDG